VERFTEIPVPLVDVRESFMPKERPNVTCEAQKNQKKKPHSGAFPPSCLSERDSCFNILATAKKKVWAGCGEEAGRRKQERPQPKKGEFRGGDRAAVSHGRESPQKQKSALNRSFCGNHLYVGRRERGG